VDLRHVDRLGVAGVGLLILLENLIPPIPSELILPGRVPRPHPAASISPWGGQQRRPGRWAAR
jgi:hypothetical protein